MGEVEGGRIQCGAAGLDLGHLQDVVDEAQEVLAAPEDGVDVVPMGLGQLRIPLHELAESQDGVHGSPNLVAHVRQEVALGHVSGFGGFFCFGQSLRRLPRLRDVLGDAIHMQGIALFIAFHASDGANPCGFAVGRSPVRVGDVVERNFPFDGLLVVLPGLPGDFGIHSFDSAVPFIHQMIPVAFLMRLSENGGRPLGAGVVLGVVVVDLPISRTGQVQRRVGKEVDALQLLCSLLPLRDVLECDPDAPILHASHGSRAGVDPDQVPLRPVHPHLYVLYLALTRQSPERRVFLREHGRAVASDDAPLLGLQVSHAVLVSADAQD